MGLIGLGYVGKIHLWHGLGLDQAKIVAVSDVSRKALKNAKKVGIKDTYSDYRQLLKNSNVDAVIIALPTHLHKDCALYFAEAEKDIFLEKPLARDPVEGREIVRAAEKHKVKLMIGYPLRFNPSFRSLKEQLQSGSLGEVQTAIASFMGPGPLLMHRRARTDEGYIPRPVPSWWFDKKLTGGGVLIDFGCHLINLLRWYFGEIVDIKSYFGHRFNLDVEDYATCIAKFSTRALAGQTAVINVGWFSLNSLVRVELFGTARHAYGESIRPSRMKHAFQLLTRKKSNLPYFRELEHFVHCVRNDIPPTPSGMDALGDLEVISKAYNNMAQFESDTRATS